MYDLFRDRPFNLQGGGGDYGFLFRLEQFFRTAQELEYLFFLSRKAQKYFFSNIGNQNIFLEKKTITPPPLSS
jgi:hypothetical protein